MTNIDAEKLIQTTNLSKSTILKRLRELEEKDLIIRHKEGRKKLFSFNLNAF